MRKQNRAFLSNQNGDTIFQFDGHVIRFNAPYSLERYIEVKEWDNGYLVVSAKYSHISSPEEEYIDLVPILEKMNLNAADFLQQIKEIIIAYE